MHFYLELTGIVQHSQRRIDSSLESDQSRDYHHSGGVDSHGDDGRATCIVFSYDNLPLEGSNHTRPLYISIDCSGHRVSSVLLNNGSALNVYPLATAIALGYAPSDFGPSNQIVRAYDNTRREVMSTLEIELLIDPTTFITVFQVLRIPISFNPLLGRPWIHRVGAIPYSLHQKVRFIHDGQVIIVQ